MGRRPILFYLSVALLLFAIPYVRAIVESRQALSAAEAALETDVDEAVRAFRHAIEWHAPLNPYSKRAVAALQAIGSQALEADNQAVALKAFESLRSGALVNRGIFEPFGQEIAEAEQVIASIRGLDPAGGSVATQLELLQTSRERAPHRLAASLVSVAFVGWLVFCFLFLSSKRGSSRSIFVAGAVISFAAWVGGLNFV